MLSKLKLLNMKDFIMWRHTLNESSNLLHVTAHNPPDVYPCYVLWKDGNEFSLGTYGYVYYFEF